MNKEMHCTTVGNYRRCVHLCVFALRCIVLMPMPSQALEVWTEATDLLAKHGTQAQQHVSSLLRRWRMPSFLDAYGGYTVSVSSIPYASQFNSSHRKVNLREWVQSWNQANSTGADSPGRPRSSLFQLQEAVHEAPEYLFSNDFLRQTQSDPEDSVLFDDMQYITKQILSEVPGITVRTCSLPFAGCGTVIVTITSGAHGRVVGMW